MTALALTACGDPRSRFALGRQSSRNLASGISALLAALLLASAGPLLAAGRYETGDHLHFTGLVTDAEGQPVDGVRVILEASRSYFSLRELRTAEKDVRRVSATTDARGEYSLDWTWDGYFNRFRLVVAVPVRKGREETLHRFEESDVTRRALAGTPVVASLVLQDRKFLDRLRAFLASIKTGDEHKVYDEAGTPDEVKQTQFAGNAASHEASWWYYGSGTVYRFRDGHLEEVAHFDPVHDFKKP